LGFKNKKVGHLIYIKIKNRKDTHLSSINPIEIDQGSDHEIEDFLAQEDLEIQGSRRQVIIHTEPYDFMTNLLPRLKGNEGFSGIGQYLEQTIGNTEAPLVDCVPH
jgi:hypothetical protein